MQISKSKKQLQAIKLNWILLNKISSNIDIQQLSSNN